MTQFARRQPVKDSHALPAEMSHSFAQKTLAFQGR
jgi:hypothetical protein